MRAQKLTVALVAIQCSLVCGGAQVAQYALIPRAVWWTYVKESLPEKIGY